MQVSQIHDLTTGKSKKIEYIRFPLRLGKDVFTYGEITPKTEEKFVKLMLAFKQFLELYEVDDYMVCATSAMREAHNGADIAKRVYYNVGLRIRIIDGQEEGSIISHAIDAYIGNGDYLHVDVGGGSTEFSIIRQKRKIAGHSFRMGSVRQLSDEKTKVIFAKMSNWLQLHLPSDVSEISMVGTGGNIKKLCELATGSKGNTLSADLLMEISENIASHSYEKRIKHFNMNADRADVIVPASKIYMEALSQVKAKEVVVPDVGLKDGMILHLCHKHRDG